VVNFPKTPVFIMVFNISDIWIQIILKFCTAKSENMYISKHLNPPPPIPHEFWTLNTYLLSLHYQIRVYNINFKNNVILLLRKVDTHVLTHFCHDTASRKLDFIWIEGSQFGIIIFVDWNLSQYIVYTLIIYVMYTLTIQYKPGRQNKSITNLW
jgi:hypothetical protein